MTRWRAAVWCAASGCGWWSGPPVPTTEPAAPKAASAPVNVDQVLPGEGTCTWYGVELPLPGGAVHACELTTARIRHTGTPTAELRESYTVLFEGAAWLREDQGASRSLRRGDRTVDLTSFKSSDGGIVDVVLLLR